MADEATDVLSDGFTANWSEVDGATGYLLDVSESGFDAGAGAVLSENFDGFITEGGSVDCGADLDDYTEQPGWTGEKVYEAAGVAKLGTASLVGHLITPTVDLSGNNGQASLSFWSLAWTNDNTEIEVWHAADGVTFAKLGDTISLTESWVEYTREITDGTEDSLIKIEALGTKARFFLNDFVLSQSGEPEYLTGYEAKDVGDDTEWEVTGLDPETTYYYRVRATAEDGDILSDYSNVESATTLAGAGPNIIVSGAALDDFDTVLGTPSDAQTFTVEGTDLDDNIWLEAPDGFELSLDDTDYDTELYIETEDGAVEETTVYVRLTGADAGTFSGNIEITSDDATTRTKAVSGEVLGPEITLSAAALVPFSTVCGEASDSQSFTVEGENLSDDILVEAPAGFEVSLDDDDYDDYAIIEADDGVVEETTVYVRLTGAAVGTPSGNIEVSSDNATTQNKAVSGSVGLAAPVADEASNILSDGFTANWDAVSGATGYRLDVSTFEDFCEGEGEGGDNLLENPGFEEGDTSGWTVSGGTTIITDDPYEGDYAVKAFHADNRQDIKQLVTIEGDGETEYELSFWYKCEEEGGAGMRIWSSWTLGGMGDGDILQPTTYLDRTDEWTQAVYHVIPSDGENVLNFEIRVMKGTTGYLDSLYVGTGSGGGCTPSFVDGYEDLDVGNVTDYDVEDLEPETTYYYRVRATAEDGDLVSGNSNAIEVETLAAGPIELTIAGAVANSKDYDGTTNATVDFSAAYLVGVEEGDDVEIDWSSYSATFDSADAGTEIEVAVTGLALTGDDAAKYALADDGDLTLEADIEPLAMTIYPDVDQSKTYGDSDPDSFTFTNYPALVSGDSFTGALDRDTGETVDTYAYALGNLSAGDNYDLSLDDGEEFEVTAKELTVTGAAAQDKTYDGGKTATVDFSSAQLGGVVGSDSVSLATAGYSAEFDSAGVGEDIAVSVTGLTLSGDDATNYTLTQPTGLKADITALGVVITPTAGQSKVYGASDSAFGYAAAPALLGDDVFTGSLSRAAGEGVGTYAYALGTLSAGGNYSLSLDEEADEFEITTLEVVITPTAGQSKVYGQSDPVFGYSAAPALLGDDEFSGALARVAGENVGDYAYTLGTLSAGGNYSLSLDEEADEFEITALEVVITPTASQSKVYGASDPVFGYSTAPSLLGEDEFVGALARAAGENVGDYAYTLGTLSAGDNYSLPLDDEADEFEITTLEVVITPTASQSKVYGQSDPVFGYSAAPALLGEDEFNGALSRAAGENVGDYAYALGTLSAGGNYSLTLDDEADEFEITTLEVVITPTASQSKVYGQNDPVFGYSAAPSLLGDDEFTGALSRDTGEDVGTYAYDLGTLSAGGNYDLSLDDSEEFEITAKALTVTGATADDKDYDGTTDATISGATLVGVEDGDDVELDDLVGTFASANAGTGIAVTAALTLTGDDAGNYTLDQPTGLTADISALAVTIYPDADQSKTYGASDPAFTYTADPELLGADEFTGALGRASGDGVGTYAYALGSLSAGGNYDLSLDDGEEFEITAKALTVTGATADDKDYDGTTDATISGATLVGVVGEDDVELDDLVGTFASANAGTGIAVTAALTLTGEDAGNYTLTQPTGLTADISALAVTIYPDADQSKTYGASDPAFTYTADPELLGDDEFTGALSRDSGTAVGFYAYTLGTLSAGGNYDLSLDDSEEFEITAKALTVSGITADNKPYDGTSDATLDFTNAELDGALLDDSVSLVTSGYSAAFPSAAVGNGLGVTVSGLSLDGDDAGNYTLPQPTGLSANITAKELTVSGAKAEDKVYDATTAATITSASLVGVVGSDDVSLGSLTGVFAQETVGEDIAVTAALTLTGVDAGNYTLTQPTGLTADILAEFKAYDQASYYGAWTSGSQKGYGFGAWTISSGGGDYKGFDLADPAARSLTGMLNPSFRMWAHTGNGTYVNADRSFDEPMEVGDVFSFKWAFNYDSGDLGGGTNGIKGFRLMDAGNNRLVSVTNSNNADLTLNGVSMGFKYGTKAMTWSITYESETNLLVHATGRLEGEEYTVRIPISAAPNQFRLFVSNMQGGSGANMRYPYFNEFKISEDERLSQTITFAEGDWQSKVYGDATFDLLASASSGLDVAFESLNPVVATLSGNTVTIVGLGQTTIRATQAGDAQYLAAEPVERVLTVTAKALTVEDAAADDKVYDGNTDATISGATLVDVVGDDDVELDDLVGEFESANVGSGISVTAALTLKGDDAGNYTLEQPTGLTADITKATPTIETEPSADELTEGQSLADSVLSGGSATVEGVFAWTDGTVVPPVGESQQSVTFTPTDSANYDPVVFTITVTVEPEEEPEPPVIEPITFDAGSGNFLFDLPELDGYEWQVQGADLEIGKDGYHNWQTLEEGVDFIIEDGKVVILTERWMRKLIRMKFVKK